jgi:hypothetical protein
VDARRGVVAMDLLRLRQIPLVAVVALVAPSARRRERRHVVVFQKGGEEIIYVI